jgi:hypothetical protein
MKTRASQKGIVIPAIASGDATTGTIGGPHAREGDASP